MTLTALDIGLALIGTYVAYSYLKVRSLKLPPGPTGLPIIGNILDMPKSHEWLTFSTWGKKYGTYSARRCR